MLFPGGKRPPNDLNIEIDNQKISPVFKTKQQGGWLDQLILALRGSQHPPPRHPTPPHQPPPPRLPAPTPTAPHTTPPTAPSAAPSTHPHGTPHHPTNRPLRGSQHPPPWHTTPHPPPRPAQPPRLVSRFPHRKNSGGQIKKNGTRVQWLRSPWEDGPPPRRPRGSYPNQNGPSKK